MSGRSIHRMTLDGGVYRGVSHLAGSGVECLASFFGAFFRRRRHKTEINGFGHAAFGQPDLLLDEPEQPCNASPGTSVVCA